jgi:hypothetical protein
MVDRRLFLIFFAVTLFVSVLYAERARNDNLQDEEIDFAEDNTVDEDDSLIETIKRFLTHKKTTTEKPSSGAISALFPTTPSTKTTSTSTKSSIFGGVFGKKSSTTLKTTTSRHSHTRLTTGATKDACGVINPCKNGGSCKTLSSGRYYCFCAQDYYGKTCENKFITTGADNKDRARVDHCAKSPCRNGGECVGLRTTFYCRCKTPYYGINCDKKISKREEIIDESNSSEQELTAYERDLQDDTEDYTTSYY